jgi:hypothetical protein
MDVIKGYIAGRLNWSVNSGHSKSFLKGWMYAVGLSYIAVQFKVKILHIEFMAIVVCRSDFKFIGISRSNQTRGFAWGEKKIVHAFKSELCK